MNVSEFLTTPLVPDSMEWSDLMSTTIMPETTTASPDIRTWLTNVVLQVGFSIVPFWGCGLHGI